MSRNVAFVSLHTFGGINHTDTFLKVLPGSDRFSNVSARCPANVVSSETLDSIRAYNDTVLPLSEPIQGVDGSLVHEIPIPKGTNLLLGLAACNKSKKIWGDDAGEWKPERWLSPLPSSVEKARIPGVYANLYVFNLRNVLLSSILYTE